MSSKKNKTINDIKMEDEVEDLLEDWDRVICYKCGKSLSLFDSTVISIDGYEKFVCRNHKEDLYDE